MPIHQLPRTLLAFILLASATLGAVAQDNPQPMALWPGEQPASTARITLHRPDQPNHTAIIICPGGGYGRLVTGPEGHLIAHWLNAHGITGIVLEYELPRGRPNVPLADAQRALRTARANAADWGIDPDRIGIMGFSAGGHLASTAGTHFDEGQPDAADPIRRMSSRPDFMVLVYPVISMGEIGHGGSRRQLLGPDPTPEQIENFSNELQVTDRTPPAYLAHAADDRVVDPANSARFHAALIEHGVASTYLELPEGNHGLNGYQGPMWEAWKTGCLTWLAEQEMIPERP